MIEGLSKSKGLGAQHVFNVVARYLVANGWYQDGDDPGIWRNGDFNGNIGDALEWQIFWDRVDTSFLFDVSE